MTNSRKTIPSSAKPQDLFALGDLLQQRADDHAGGEIAEHRAKPQLLEDGRRDHSAAKQQQGL